MIENIDTFLGQETKPKKLKKKKCSMCKKFLTVDNFYTKSKTNKNIGDGLLPHCIECAKERSNNQRKIYKERNKDKNPYNITKKFCPHCREWKIKTKDNWHRDNEQKDGLCRLCIKCHCISRRIWTYGISLEEYHKLLEEQENKCKICGIEITEGKHSQQICVDHNHYSKEKEVRGLLCPKCNTGLGGFKDNPYSLFKAIKYLRGELD